jgi:choline dehydrogenase
MTGDAKGFDLTADYVVIGGGSAGAVVASRLAEQRGVTVILVEAGGSGRNPFLMLPGAMTFIKDWSRHAWLYPTEPDPSRGGRVDTWKRGRSLGGSSSINGLIWARGLPRDFDSWAALGATGWAWEDVRPHFMQAERALGFDAGERGQSGPVWVETFRSPHPLSVALLASFGKAGFPIVADINQARTAAAAITQTNQRGGIRQSTETAYLRRPLPGLRIVDRTMAQRLLFVDGRAVGAELRRDDGSELRVAANREVIVCAGAIESPSLLMRSGIGPADALRALGITPVADSPEVGMNMQDHPDLYVEYAVSRSTYSDAGRWYRLPGAGLQFLLRRGGPATSPGTHVFAYGSSHGRLEDPDLLFFTGPFGQIVEGAFTGRQSVYSVTPSICRPHSRGRVWLAERNPRVAPRIQPNLLGDERDLALIVDAIGMVDGIVRHPPFSDDLIQRVRPGAALQRADRAGLEAFARAAVATCHHSCGTCRMGSDSRAVVDPSLRVRGVANLRVADASIFPQITSGNLNAPVIMVGERAAALIKAGG